MKMETRLQVRFLIRCRGKNFLANTVKSISSISTPLSRPSLSILGVPPWFITTHVVFQARSQCVCSASMVYSSIPLMIASARRHRLALRSTRSDTANSAQTRRHGPSNWGSCLRHTSMLECSCLSSVTSVSTAFDKLSWPLCQRPYQNRGEKQQPWDSNDVLSSAELSTSGMDDRKSSSTSFDAIENVRRNYKDYEDSMGAWHNQATRSSRDSQVEGTEEMSPMSKRIRREAKVLGKLLPLLECLRATSAHMFGSIFKHKLESQDNTYYQSMIRRHVDLATVRSILEEGSYSGSVEFFRDQLLVFNNALIYYSKYSQEFVAAYVLRELATKDMTNIFQIAALLKQEDPSTTKREPRKLPEFFLSSKPNPTPMVPSGKRNTINISRRLLGGLSKRRTTNLRTSISLCHTSATIPTSRKHKGG